MSTRTAGRPRITDQVTALVTAVGVVALAASTPVVALGAVAGAVVSVAVVRTTTGQGHAVPAAFLSAGVVSLLMLLASTSGSHVALTVVGIVVGLGGGALAVDDSVESLHTLERVAFQGMVVAVCGFAGSIVFLSARDTVTSFVVGDAVSLGWLTLLSGLSVAAAVALAPPAMFPLTDNRREEAVVVLKRQLAALVTLVSVFLAPFSGFLGVLAPDTITGSPVVRLPLVVVLGAGVVLSGVGLYARWSWYAPDTGQDPAVPTSLGTVGGILVAVAAIGALGGPDIQGGWFSLFVLAIPTFAAALFVLVRYAEFVSEGPSVPAASVTAATLCLGGVLVATTVPADEPTGTGVTGLAAVTAIAAGLFVYKASSFGRVAGMEVGADAVGRRVQAVRLGWVGGLTGLGLVLAVATLWLATVFAPTFAVPATAGTVAACVAFLAGAWLLLR